MDTLRVNHSNTTLEILAKIMNSYAVKYDCSVKYMRNIMNFLLQEKIVISIP